VKGIVVALEFGVLSLNSSVVWSFTRTGAKYSTGSHGNPKSSAKKRAAAILSRAGTMVWFRTTVMTRLLIRLLSGKPSPRRGHFDGT
jgi:hypothetical protein